MKKVKFFNGKASETDVNKFIEEHPNCEVFFVNEMTKIVYEDAILESPFAAYKGITKPIEFLMDEADPGYDYWNYSPQKILYVYAMEFYKSFIVLKTMNGFNMYMTNSNEVYYNTEFDLKLLDKVEKEIHICVDRSYIYDKDFELYKDELQKDYFDYECTKSGNRAYKFEYNTMLMMCKVLGFKEYESDSVFELEERMLIENYTLNNKTV